MNQTTPSLPAAEVLRLVCRALDEKKAEDLRVLDVGGQSSITDYLVIATGNSEPHLRALRVELEKVLDQAKVRIVGMDTEQGSGWMVVDAFDVMAHLFTPQMRETYRLETLWKDATELTLAQVLAGNLEKPARKPAAKKAAPAKKKAAVKKPAAGKAKAKTKAKTKASVSTKKAVKPAPRKPAAKAGAAKKAGAKPSRKR